MDDKEGFIEHNCDQGKAHDFGHNTHSRCREVTIKLIAELEEKDAEIVMLKTKNDALNVIGYYSQMDVSVYQRIQAQLEAADKIYEATKKNIDVLEYEGDEGGYELLFNALQEYEAARNKK